MVLDGAAPPNAKGRERLSARSPIIEQALACLPIDPETLPSAREFGNRLAADAKRWQHLRGGCGERGRISKADAARMLALALRALPVSSTPNSLASYRLGGVK